MINIKLSSNGEFKISTIKVLSKEKNGKVIGIDENKKPIYERLPATFWTTTDGKFNSKNLDKPKSVDDYFEIKTVGDIDVAKATLTQFAVQHLEGLIAHCKERITVLSEQVNEQNMKVLQASQTLKRLSEVEL